MNRKIKFAVIGCGHIGKREAEMISQNDETKRFIVSVGLRFV